MVCPGGCANDAPLTSWFTCSFKFKTLVTTSAALVAGMGTIFALYPEQTKKVLFLSSAASAALATEYVYKMIPKVTYSQEREVIINEGINFINLQDGEDFVSASLCKLSKSITVINNFDPEQDHLRLFCSKKIELASENVSVEHYYNLMTILTIQGNQDISKIYFLGDINIQPEDILFGKI